MYRYDAVDATLVRERIAEFRGQVARRLSGDLSEEEFKPLRLMNGLYLQLHAYMLRVAIPYGVLSSRQLRALAHVARTYDKGYGHMTTRQNIQFNWPALVDAPAILEALAEVDMHAIQTSGNCIRNVTADHYAGATADEVEDPRPWCELIRQWSTVHPEFSYLPRKFKIAVTGAPRDRAAVRMHDIGLILTRGPDGGSAFEVLVGGGLGRTPMLGQTIRDNLPTDQLLSYLTAILRVYNLLGRRDNAYKARIKILVGAEGLDRFRALVEAEWADLKTRGVDPPLAEIDRIRGHFRPPPFAALPDRDAGFEAARAADPAFDRWARVNLAPHRKPGYAIVNISLKPPGRPPGDVTAEQLETVADLAQRHSFDEARATHAQNLCLPHVPLADLHEVFRKLTDAGLATANVGLASDIIACPGLDYCDLANARSIPVAERLSERFAASGAEEEIGELKIKISGCINACGHHHVGHIGILGVDKKGEEFYQIMLGGSEGEDASLGEIIGPSVPAAEAVDAIERMVSLYRRERRPGERFLDAYRRLGPVPFKEAFNGAA